MLSYLTVRTYSDAPPIPDRVVDASGRTLKGNRYDLATGTLQFTEIESAAFAESKNHWGDYFSGSTAAAELPPKYIRERTELDDLAAYFTWAAWAAVANRPGKDYSYTNNWPYDPAAGNTPSGPTYLWSDGSSSPRVRMFPFARLLA